MTLNIKLLLFWSNKVRLQDSAVYSATQYFKLMRTLFSNAHKMQRLQISTFPSHFALLAWRKMRDKHRNVQPLDKQQGLQIPMLIPDFTLSK